MMYDGLNDETRDRVKIMYNFEYLYQPIDRARDFFEWFAKDTYEQEMNHTPLLLYMNHTTFVNHFEENSSCLAPSDSYNVKNLYENFYGNHDLGSEFKIENVDPIYPTTLSGFRFSNPCSYSTFEQSVSYILSLFLPI